MRWFLDTEFDKNGTTIKLISIALVSERGDEYYRVLSDGWRVEDCDPWVQQNVVPHLFAGGAASASREVVAQDVQHLLLEDGKPEVWGYFADYDWVVLCQLFGKMIDLPNGFPMYCLDMKQEMHRFGVKREQMPAQGGTAHNALEDARWIRQGWLWLRDYVAQ
jgi:hypothetical protein